MIIKKLISFDRYVDFLKGNFKIKNSDHEPNKGKRLSPLLISISILIILFR